MDNLANERANLAYMPCHAWVIKWESFHLLPMTTITSTNYITQYCKSSDHRADPYVWGHAWKDYEAPKQQFPLDQVL